ncbi:lipase family protein [Cohnella endophytica]|uniref:Lipase family protein n=1 Tax=Cohnella endophytica TaxID=2419778 RepID=A0A494XTV2_9BACL|nr:lipase family protein [Cohnella endophytica]RKP54051.1 lipase family protein [Cohnella endophytica]
MSGYDSRTAIFLAAVCSQTYACYSDPKGQFVVPEGFKLVQEIRAKSLAGVSERFGFILESDDRIIVAFRGTSSTTDWISDAVASQSKFKCVRDAGQTHRGFSNIYYSARDKILDALDELPNEKAIYVTGHSLGGALATLCAMDLAVNSSHSEPIVYTYGSPRVGDPTFSQAYKAIVGDKSYRVNNRFDVVTHLPPTVYKLPRRDKIYYYEHITAPETITFHNGSIPGNHIIGSYYAELAKRDPTYSGVLNADNPGFCPIPSRFAYVVVR